jgi:general secretion pathway protein G
MNTHSHIPTRSRRAFTLIEAIVVIVIIGVLATLIAPPLFNKIMGSKITTAGTNAKTIASAVHLYQADWGVLPEDLSLLLAKPSDGSSKGPYLNNKDELLDPWGHPFVLRVPAQKNQDFDIISYGADGMPGGTGDNEDIVKP